MKYDHCDLYGGSRCIEEIPLWLGLIIVLGIIVFIIRMKTKTSKEGDTNVADVKTIKEMYQLLAVLVAVILIPIIIRLLWS